MASVALEDIWDAPVEPSSPRTRSRTLEINIDDENDDADIGPRPSKRRRSSESLFLPGDSDDEGVHPKPTERAASLSRPDVDAMFEGLDDEDLSFAPLAPSLDVEALRRQADARYAALTPHAILPSSSPPRDLDGGEAGKGGTKAKEGGKDEEKKERKKIARLDEARLLAPDGFPALIKSTKGFKPRGKGHEGSDLTRLLNVYQFWTHKMYPKTQFRDTVDRVEKLCHSRRMHVALSVWRDESKGLVNGAEPNDAIDLTSDVEPDDAKQDEDQDDGGVRLPSLPPSSGSEPDPDDDFDIDAVIREEEARAEALRASASVSAPSVTKTAAAASPYKSTPDGGDEDEEAMWAELKGFDGSPPPPPTRPPPPQNNVDEDEDMWDAVREAEMETDPTPPVVTITSGSTSESTDVGQSEGTAALPIPTNDLDGWDDMYI